MPTEPTQPQSETTPPQSETTPPQPETMGALRSAWLQVMPDHPELGEQLISRWSEPHRVYHGVEHLRVVLRWVDELAGADHDLFVVRLAAWYHDAVYVVGTRQVSNEEASARLAIRDLSRYGFEQEDLNEVARLVRLTATHVPGSADPNGELLCDADLAVLGGSAEEYEAYRQAIRAEYATVPDETFLPARLRVMADLLRGQVFRTGGGRALEQAAVRNIRAECHALAAQLGVDVPRWVDDDHA